MNFEDYEKRLNGLLVVVGNPIKGIQIFGPFKHVQEAMEYGESMDTTDDWWVADLKKPTDGFVFPKK